MSWVTEEKVLNSVHITGAAKEVSSAAPGCRSESITPELDAVTIARLKAQLLAGDVGEFNDLCAGLLPRLCKQALVLCGDQWQAEDLVQETLIEAWRSFSRFEGRCRFFTWVCAIMIHRYRNLSRRKLFWKWQRMESLHDEHAARLRQAPDPSIRPDQAAEEAERNARLKVALNVLPQRHREIIYLRFYAGDSLEGIAAALGCSIGTVKSRLFHALERLCKTRSLHANAMFLHGKDQ